MGEAERNADAYLKRAEAELEKEKKGKMKIFFGYAAGVGKTYAMLCAAQREKRSGVDIVAGYIEPHARPETAKKVQGLETIPPIVMQMDKIAVKEMDIDGILTRRPQVVLIDEMAHTNANGSRHVKRYQDIEEILNAGIDVYTTLNVQHIESVHDTVAAITGVAVRERVPDKIFDKAAQIEMIDIPPEELIARLQAGKVYQKESVGQALGNFFSVENLTALREIALRRMADWLNREQDEALSGEVKGNATEHIMMCLSTSPSNARVIRQAARMAKAFHGKLTAFYVETSDDGQMGPENVRRLQENRKLAEKFGAKVVTSFGNDIVEQIAGYAKIARVTKIVLGRSYNRRKLFSARESMSEKLVELVPKLEIFLIPDSYDKTYVKRKRRRRRIAGNVDGYKVLWDMGAVCLSLAGQHYHGLCAWLYAHRPGVRIPPYRRPLRHPGDSELQLLFHGAKRNAQRVRCRISGDLPGLLCPVRHHHHPGEKTEGRHQTQCGEGVPDGGSAGHQPDIPAGQQQGGNRPGHGKADRDPVKQERLLLHRQSGGAGAPSV